MSGFRKNKFTKGKKKAYKKARMPAKKTIARIAQTVVTRNEETKCANYSVNSFQVVPVTSSGFVNTIKILNPTNASGGLYNIQQGVGQGSRVGNKITTHKVYLSGVMYINTTYDATANYNMCPLYVALMVVRLKPGIDDNINTLSAILSSSFYQSGNTSSGATGTIVDLTRMVNTDQIHLLHKKVYKLGVSNVVSGFGANQANNANQQYADGTVSIARMFKIDLTKTLYKEYTYNDTANDPVNRKTYLMYIPYRIDGTTITTSIGALTGPIPMRVDFNVDYLFKDA